MACPRCSTVNRNGANFCKQCGTLLVANCPRCRFDVPAGANFCDNCGLRFVETQAGWWPSAPPAAQPPLPPPSQLAPADGKPAPFLPGPPPIGASLAPAPPAAPAPVASPAPAPAQNPPAAAAPRAARGAELERYVPAELLRRLETARATGDMVGERRVVTMLFCDVKGSTAAAEHLDPEDWTEIMNGAFEHMIRPVYAYEGTVARLMGDALLAFFGAPLAHEDDPQRAVLAGLDIVAGIQSFRAQVAQQWGIDFDVRVGINTGLVVVGAVGSDLRVEYSALGDAINLAARMEQTAAPGTVQIAHDTWRLVQSIFEVEPLGGIEVKGKSEPVPAYRVRGRRASPGRARGIAGLESRLIGRDAELATLGDILLEAQRGIGRVVCLLGEAGLGKSRLLAEAHRQWRGGSQPAGPGADRWYEVSCVSYESTRPYGLIQEFLRRAGSIDRSDQADVVRGRVDSLLSLFPAERRPLVTQVMQTLLALPVDSGAPPLEGDAFQRELYTVMRTIWLQRFSGNPTVLVCDDMHWADAASVELLQRLLPLVADVPIVLVCSMRPDRDAPAWQIRTAADEQLAHRYCELLLKPLPDSAVRELLGDLLGGTVLPAELQARILDRAGGNPFFIEEVLRSLIDQGIIVRSGSGWMVSAQAAAFAIPDNLHALLTARIDRLEEHARRTVQLASVVGRSFYYRVLAALEAAGEIAVAELDRNLNALLRAEMIQEAARIPEVEYRFRNPLTQEIAYQTILVKRRRELHRQVAQAIETLFSDRLSEHAARLAFHYTEAQQPQQALKYLRIAGDAAFHLYAHTESLQFYRQALALARQVPSADGAELSYLWLRIGRTLELQARYEEALAGYRAMEAEALQRADRALELAALMAQGTLYSTANRFFNPESGDALTRRGLALARELGDEAAEAKLYWNLLNMHRFTTRLAEAEEAGERSLSIARRLNLREQLAFTLNDMYYVKLNRGNLEAALATALEARALWRELDNRVMLADSLSSTVTSYALTGQIDTALADSQEAYALSESTGNEWGMSFSRMFVGYGLRPRAQFDRALAELQSALDYGDHSGFIAGQLFGRAELGLVLALLGQFPRAVELVQSIVSNRAFTEFQENVFRATLAQIYLLMGDLDAAEQMMRPVFADPATDGFARVILAGVWPALLLERKEFARAAETAADYLARLRAQGIRLAIPELLWVQGRCQLALGELDAARATLDEAEREASAMGLRWWLWQVQAAQSRVAAAAGDEPAAQRLLAAARAGLTQIANEVSNPEYRASLLARPVVRALFD